MIKEVKLLIRNEAKAFELLSDKPTVFLHPLFRCEAGNMELEKWERILK